MVKYNTTLLHPKGGGTISLSLEHHSSQWVPGGYLLRINGREKTRPLTFESLSDAVKSFYDHISNYIRKGYFVPSKTNDTGTLDYTRGTISHAIQDIWDPVRRLPIDNDFFTYNYLRELHDGHHVKIKLCPSETNVFLIEDGRGAYTPAKALISKLSILHAYGEISGFTLDVTLQDNGDLVINDVMQNTDENPLSRQHHMRRLERRISASPISFVHFAKCFFSSYAWQHRDNTTGYVALNINGGFDDAIESCFFPGGKTYRVSSKSLYKLYISDTRTPSSDFEHDLTEYPRLFILGFNDKLVIKDGKLYQQPFKQGTQFLPLTNRT